MSELTIAFLGCGMIASAHWRGIQKHAPRLRVTAAIDRDPERARDMADRTGGQAFTSLEDALERGDFDAVDIMLPHDLHEAMAIRAFEAGKHVVLEKPMAPTLDACDRIMEAARAAGTVFMVAEQSQFWPDAMVVQRLIEEGAIGEVIYARMLFGGKAGSSWGGDPWRYHADIAGGGIVIDGGSHHIRPLRMWLGEIDEVVGITGRPLPAMEGESLALALFRFESGVVAAFEAWRAGAANVPGEVVRVVGYEGTVVVERKAERVLLYDAAHREGIEVMGEMHTREDAFGLELADFRGAVLDGAPLAAGPAESLGELRTALALYRSAETQRWEKVWDDSCSHGALCP